MLAFWRLILSHHSQRAMTAGAVILTVYQIQV